MLERKILLREPTAARWRKALQMLLAGDYDYEFRDLGGVEEFVERQFARATNREKCEAAFEIALNDEVIAWQVSRRASAYRVKGLLRLICAYTPPSGFAKAYELLEEYLGTGALGFGEKDADFASLALMALSRYYRTAPPNPSKDAAFRRFVELLGRLRAHPDLGGAAVRQLLEVGAESLADPKFARTIVSSSSSLSAAGDYAVLPPGAWSAEHLSVILTQCVMTDDPARLHDFVNQVESHGAPVIVEDELLIVAPADGEKVVLRVPDENIGDYLLLKWRAYDGAGLTKYDELTRG
jgi:hypothetical protein